MVQFQYITESTNHSIRLLKKNAFIEILLENCYKNIDLLLTIDILVNSVNLLQILSNDDKWNNNTSESYSKLLKNRESIVQNIINLFQENISNENLKNLITKLFMPEHIGEEKYEGRPRCLSKDSNYLLEIGLDGTGGTSDRKSSLNSDTKILENDNELEDNDINDDKMDIEVNLSQDDNQIQPEYNSKPTEETNQIFPKILTKSPPKKKDPSIKRKVARCFEIKKSLCILQCKLLEVREESEPSSTQNTYNETYPMGYVYFVRDRWNSIKSNFHNLTTLITDSLKLDEDILNCIFYGEQCEYNLHWAVHDFQKVQLNMYDLLTNFQLFCKKADQLLPDKMILGTESNLIGITQIFELLQFELRIIAIQCHNQGVKCDNKKLLIELPIECIELNLLIIDMVWGSYGTEDDQQQTCIKKSCIKLNLIEFNKIVELLISYFSNNQKKDSLLIKILEFFPKFINPKNFSILNENNKIALEQSTEFQLLQLKTVQDQLITSKVLNCFYDIFYDESFDEIFVKKNVYKTLKVTF